MTIERRLLAGAIEVRTADAQPPVIAGYGAVFGSETVIAGMFRERIEPGAFRQALADADVRGTFDHELVLGRTTNGTLRLIEDRRGLRYEIEPNPKDSAAMDVVARIQRGDVTGSSFGFRVADGGDHWTRAANAGELPLRVITAFALVKDVGPVSFPAYDETTAEARNQAEERVMAAFDVRDDTGEKHKTASGKVGTHYAGTDGKSFPITDPVDVDHAAHALGRTNQDRDTVKANIIRIAYEMGPAYVAKLPNDWKKAKDQQRDAADDPGDTTANESAAVAACQDALAACSAVIKACEPLLPDDDCGAVARELVAQCASLLVSGGRFMACLSGQDDIYSYYASRLAVERRRLELLALD